MQTNSFKYIIITPAKNEADFITGTIESVIHQSIKPLLWIIVDDGSTDNTSEIVNRYQKNYSFIKLVSRVSEEKRNFGNKVYAIQRGFEEVGDMEYSFYCNLDADVEFESKYFEFLLSEFNNNPQLGISGGKVFDLVDGKLIEQESESHSVAGPVQFFRKECYESFGGYKPSPIGFIDGYAEISARMNGWETRTFAEQKVIHNRPVGTHRGSTFKHFYQGGQIEYLFGYSYLYHLIRNTPRIFKRPFFLGYLTTLAGFHVLAIKRTNRFVNRNFIDFVQKEQRMRLFNKLKFFFLRKD